MLEAVPRHKTAITRVEPSRPLKTAITDGVLTPDKSVFDYGCGLGDDIRLLTAQGFTVHGWDPVHRPEHEWTHPLRPQPILRLLDLYFAEFRVPAEFFSPWRYI